jgi:hypothetical protein
MYLFCDTHGGISWSPAGAGGSPPPEPPPQEEEEQQRQRRRRRRRPLQGNEKPHSVQTWRHTTGPHIRPVTLLHTSEIHTDGQNLQFSKTARCVNPVRSALVRKRCLLRSGCLAFVHIGVTYSFLKFCTQLCFVLLILTLCCEEWTGVPVTALYTVPCVSFRQTDSGTITRTRATYVWSLRTAVHTCSCEFTTAVCMVL